MSTFYEALEITTNWAEINERLEEEEEYRRQEEERKYNPERYYCVEGIF